MGFKLILLVAVAVLGLGNLLHIIGLATPEWVTMKIYLPFLGTVEQTSGLWAGCINDECSASRMDGKPDWLKASEAMAILGMLIGLVALIMAGLYFIMGVMGKDSSKSLGILSLLASVVAFIVILICVSVYAVEVKDDDSRWAFGYSFGLSIAGAIIIMIGGCIAFAGSR